MELNLLLISICLNKIKTEQKVKKNTYNRKLTLNFVEVIQYEILALFVRSTSTDDCASTDSHSPSPLTPAAVSPRTTNFFYPTAARIFNKVSRQSSRCGSATPAPGNDDTLLPGSSEPPR